MRVAMFCPGPKPPAPAPASPAPLRKPATKKTVVFGSDKDLGIVLTSDDPLDQLWLEIDKDGDGKLGEEEVCQVLVMMKRATETGAPRTKEIAQTVMKELDTDGSGDIDIGEFQDWYNAQPERTVGAGSVQLPVRIASAGAYAQKRGLKKGMAVLKCGEKGKEVDTTKMSLRDIDRLIKRAGRPLHMEFDARAKDIQNAEVAALQVKAAALATEAAAAAEFTPAGFKVHYDSIAEAVKADSDSGVKVGKV